jgi:hypothetical protein
MKGRYVEKASGGGKPQNPYHLKDLSTLRDIMGKKNRSSTVKEETVKSLGPKMPISKAEMAKALCKEGTYDAIEAWMSEIGFFAQESDVTDVLKAINKNIDEDIYYTKLLVMLTLAAKARSIDAILLDRLATLFTDNLTALRAASSHYGPETFSIDEITNGLFLNLKRAANDPKAFVNGLLSTVPKEEWDKLAQEEGAVRSNIPILVAMKAIEDDIPGAQWSFLQALATGYDAKLFYEDDDMKWDFKFCLNRALDRNPGYNETVSAYIPYLAAVVHRVRDPAVKDDVLFWLSSRFLDLLTGNRSMDEVLLKTLFNSMLELSKSLKPDTKVADRFPFKVWDTLAEAMKGTGLGPETKEFFAGIIRNEEWTVGRTAKVLGDDIEAQLKVLRISTAPNERFIAVDRLRLILSMNLIPLSPKIRSEAIEIIFAEVKKEADRIVRNGLIELVLGAGLKEHVKAMIALLRERSDDRTWIDLSASEVSTEPFGDLFYKDLPTRTLTLMGVVVRSLEEPLDEDLVDLAERLSMDQDPKLRFQCYRYLLSCTNGDRFVKAALEIVKGDLPFRVIVHEGLRPLFGPDPIEGGLEFSVKEQDISRLVSALKGTYDGSSDEVKARMRRILIQVPSEELKDVFYQDITGALPFPQEGMTDAWLQLGFLLALGPKVQTMYESDKLIVVRAYTQARLERVLNDTDLGSRLSIVNIFKVMKDLGLKIAPMKLVDAVLNNKMSFEQARPALDVIQEDEWNSFLSETVDLFNAKLDGIEHRLDLILTKFCNYIRETRTKWYEQKWHNILTQMVLGRSVGGTFMGFWTAKDRELALFWVKEDHESTNWSVYIAILWNISDEEYRLKKVVPAVLKNWRDDGLWALGELDRLDQPLDVISTDKALATLYSKVWDKYPDSRKALMERWWSTEHFVEACKDLKKAKKDAKVQQQEIIDAGLEWLSHALIGRYRDGRYDPAVPLEGTGPLIKALEDFLDNNPFDSNGSYTRAFFCTLAGGWEPFLGRLNDYIQKVVDEVAKGTKVEYVYSDEPNDDSLPAFLLKALEQGHIEALRPLMQIVDNHLVVGMEGWSGSDGRFERLTDLLAQASLGPVDVAKALDGHQELQMAYLLKVRKGSLKVMSGEKRPNPMDFGMNSIIYEL